jgi:hypothetical protein
METDEPIITHCGKTVDPAPIFGCREDLGRDVVLREAGKIAKSFCEKHRTATQARAIVQARQEWTNWEI